MAADEREQTRAEAGRLEAAREKERASLARKQERAQKEAAHAAQSTEKESAAAARMADLVATLGHELAEVLQDVPVCDLRKEVQEVAQLFEVTRWMTSVEGWSPNAVLPTLQTQLAAGTHAMGQPMSAQLAQHDHLEGMPRVYMALSTMAQAVQTSSSGAKGRNEAAGTPRINAALQGAAEKLAAAPAAQVEVARLGELQQAAARDESRPRCARRRPRR